MLKTLFYSLKKSKKINKISKVIGDTSGSDGVGYEGFEKRMEAANKRQEAKEALFDLVMNDPQSSKIIGRHEVGRATIEMAYDRLVEAGAAQWAGGHFVPVSSVVYPFCLDYLLENLKKEDNEFYRVAHRLLLYFRNNEVGKVED